MLHATNVGDDADPVMRGAAKDARVGVVVLDKYFLSKACPMEELRIIMRQRSCLPVLLDLNHTQFKVLVGQRTQQDMSAEDAEMLRQLLRITMEKPPRGSSSDPHELARTAVFAIVQRLVDSHARGLPGSPADLDFLQRLKAAAVALSGPAGLPEHRDAANKLARKLTNMCEQLVEVACPLYTPTQIGICMFLGRACREPLMKAAAPHYMFTSSAIRTANVRPGSALTAYVSRLIGYCMLRVQGHSLSSQPRQQPPAIRSRTHLDRLAPPWSQDAYHNAGPGVAEGQGFADGTLAALCATAAARVLLWGMVGIGKTMVARHIAMLPTDRLSGPGSWRRVIWTHWGMECTGATPRSSCFASCCGVQGRDECGREHRAQSACIIMSAHHLK